MFTGIWLLVVAVFITGVVYGEVSSEGRVK
jgi:hypothetical protein